MNNIKFKLTEDADGATLVLECDGREVTLTRAGNELDIDRSDETGCHLWHAGEVLPELLWLITGKEDFYVECGDVLRDYEE